MQAPRKMSKPRAFSVSPKSIIITAVVIATVAGPAFWWLNREANCRELLDRTKLADERIVRDETGRCYACRDEGWLYDIAFETCPLPAAA